MNTNLSGAVSLVYSTYLGGLSIEEGYGIAADSAGHAYVTGYTASSTFPFRNGVQGVQSRVDAFVTKLDTTASGDASLLYSTFLGGVTENFFDGDDKGDAIAADASGFAYVRPGFSMEQDASTNHGARSNTPINDGNFHHVAVTRLGNIISIYIDGLIDASDTKPGIVNSVNSPELIAGKAACTGVDGTLSFTGLLDELEIFDRALSTSEIQSIVSAGSAGKCRTCTPPPSGMTAWWAGDGNANDIQGSNHGILMKGRCLRRARLGKHLVLMG